MSGKIGSLYKTLNLLSIDVAIGAVCSAYFMASIFHKEISILSAIVLGLSVWLIYTVDHLMDAVQLKRSGMIFRTYRHQFHSTYFNWLRVACLVSFFSILISLAFIPRELILNGLALTAIVSAYLLLNSFLSLGKEFIIAACYISGVLLPSQIETHQLLANSSVLILISFFITVLFNVVMFSFFDLEMDSIENKKSFVTKMGVNRVHFLFSILYILQFIIALLLIPSMQAAAGLTLFIMTSIMFILVYLKKEIGTTLSRIAGEAVFFIPGFYCLFF